MKPDIKQAIQFLHRLAGDTLITFQTFDDSPEDKNPKLARIFHGLTEKNFCDLTSLQFERAGVFFMVNQGNGKGRKAENVTVIRAVFIDLDGTPLPESWGVVPHITVESSPGKFHVYWLVFDCPLNRYTPTQKALIKKFKSDSSVHDLPRVLRVPGFYHQKGQPFMTRIISTSEMVPYTLQQIIDGLGLNFDIQTPPTLNGKANKNTYIFNGM